MSYLVRLRTEFSESIKSKDTEEKLDLIFYRPLGFLIAKIGCKLKLRPSHLSFLGLVSGIMAAVLYGQFPTSTPHLIMASMLFLLSGIFDSSDGQLARLAGNGSKLGLIIDGICDAGVTIAIYIGIFWIQLNSTPILIIPVFLSILAHSYQCSILDFYHREYLYFGYGKISMDYWNPTNDEMNIAVKQSSGIEKILNILRRNWVKQQSLLSTRSDDTRLKMRAFLTGNEDNKNKTMYHYKKTNLQMLTYWRLIGTNAHTITIITLALINKAELLFLFSLLIFNLVILFGRIIQKQKDNELIQNLEI